MIHTKLKYNFEAMELDDHIVEIPVGDDSSDFRGVVKLNKSAEEIFSLLRRETSEDEIVKVLQSRYEDDSAIPAYVHKVVSALIDGGVLE